jgi:mono/diheme cytochrome c family protein
MALGLFVAINVSAAAGQDAATIRRGETLVNRDCSRCHATARIGQSTHPEAPLFRTLGKRYPIEALEEALGRHLETLPDVHCELRRVALRARFRAVGSTPP